MSGKTLSEYWLSAKGKFIERGNRGKPEMPTGISWIDEATDGLHRGEVWTIAGRAGGGKTSLALQIARGIADKPDMTVLFITLEMRGEDIVARLFCEMMDYEFGKLRIGSFNEDFSVKEKAFLDIINGIDFEVVEYGYTFEQIEKVIKSTYKDKKPDLIVIDFIQLIDTKDGEREALEEYMRKLVEMAKKENLAFIVVSQLRRLPSGADMGRPPDMQDMKGSGSLEQLSHTVLLVHKATTEAKGHWEATEKYFIRIAKNRHGECLEKEVVFKGDRFRFEAMECFTPPEPRYKPLERKERAYNET